MNTSEILSVTSICATIIFAIPPFIKMISDAFHNNISFKIVGIDYAQTNQCYMLSMQLINYCNQSISITDIKVNNKNVLLKINDTLCSALDKTVQANENKIYILLCPELKENEKIVVKISTTKRRLRYKKRFKSIIEILNEKK